MKRDDVIWTIVYYALLFTLLWIVNRTGPPLRIVFWYRLSRISQAVAREAGALGLAAELTYYREMENVRG